MLSTAACFALLGLALLLRSGAAPNPNLTSDLNGDNKVTVTDLSILLTNWNKTTDVADINNDGKTNITDLSTLLSNWGRTATTPTPTPPGPTPQPNPNPTPNPGGISCDQAGIQQLVNSVSQANVEANLRKLVQDDTKPTPNELISRHVSAPGNKQKTTWAKQQMASYGLEVVNQPFSSGGYNLENVIARLNGTNANQLYVVGAHIDSISENAKTLAPGADDDGSGVIAVMEAAKALKPFEKCLKSTLYFNHYNDEEENMEGSPTFLDSTSGKTIKGVYNLDMIAYQPSKECLKSDVGKSSRDQFLAQKIVDMNTKYNVGLPVTTGTYTQNAGDDLEVFWSANIPGGYLIECTTEKDTDGYPDYHSTKDTTKNVNMSQVTKVAKLLVATLAEFGMQ